MKALYFMKIDHIKSKQQLLLFPIGLAAMIVLVLFGNVSGYNATVPFLYELFFAIVCCTAPFGACRRADAGFMLLLPATTRDRVVGRFLYGISLMLLAAVVGGIFMIGYTLMGHGYSTTEWAVCLIGLAVGILVMTMEYVFLYLFGESQGQQMLNFVRVIPGMCFFFGGINLSSMLVAHPDQVAGTIVFIVSHLETISIVSIVAVLIVLVAAIALCVKVADKRDC